MRHRLALIVGLLLLMAASDAGSALAAAESGSPTIRVLSNRADLISGGNALVEVVPPRGTDAAAIKVDVDGRDVTSAFALRPGGRYMGQLTGLRVGENVVTARAPGTGAARLTITNHPIGGPVLDGPQIQPWKCFQGALDAQCNRPTKYEFFYKSTRGGSLQPYNPQNPPPDVATTTTDQGKTVPYIVRQESGTIDRDEYRIAVLYDPSKPWAPWAPQEGFNRKLVVTHGASCDTDYEQEAAPGVLNETALSRGFAVMSHALDNAGHNCNILTQAESLIMTKEHLIEDYGELRYTIGSGCSGGSLTQQQVANAYPGFYQGITPACSFPDAWSSAMLYVDYLLLRQYFENPPRWAPGVAWGPDDVQSVEGHPNPANAVTFTTVIPFSGDPSRSCPGVPAEKVYDARTNPRGVRCTLQDYMVNIFGRRASSTWGPVEKQLGQGFAGRPFDNVGIEYGRKALMNGTISPAQFVDVNSKVGSGDMDAEYQQGRVAADRPALERVYRSGAVNQGTHLDEVAIIDLRGPDPGAFHDVYRTYAMRARLDREHGGHANQVLWRGFVPLLGDVGYTSESILAMDRWLAAVEADRRDLPLAEKIVRDKPESVRDRCTNGSGQELPAAECDAVVQSYSTARIEAGMPLTDDTIKCELKPLRRSDYLPIQFSDAQWAELEKTFPDGVCDYTRAGVDRVPTVPWLTYKRGPGGEPLGRPPPSGSLDGPPIIPPTGTPVPPAADRARPLARLAAPFLATSGGRFGDFPLRLRGSDRGSGIAAFSLDVRELGPRGRSRARGDRPVTGAWRPLAASTRRTSVRFRGTPGRTYEFRLVAVDRGGNRSPFAHATTVVPLDRRRSDRCCSGRWRNLRSGRAYFGALLASSTRGALLRHDYRGESFYLIARLGPRGGKALITFDGRSRVVDFYAARVKERALLFSARARPGRHTLRLRALGQRRRASRGFEVNVDAIGVLRRGR